MTDKETIRDLAFELYLATYKIQVEKSVIIGLIDKLNREMENDRVTFDQSPAVMWTEIEHETDAGSK